MSSEMFNKVGICMNVLSCILGVLVQLVKVLEQHVKVLVNTNSHEH
jgi:hypothetical protein